MNETLPQNFPSTQNLGPPTQEVGGDDPPDLCPACKLDRLLCHCRFGG